MNMNINALDKTVSFRKSILLVTIYTLLFTALLSGCDHQPKQTQQQKPVEKADTTAKVKAPAADQTLVTLPVLDALFYEKDFAAALRDSIGLTAAQIGQLKSAAHISLRELSEDGSADTTSAKKATQNYQDKIRSIIGADKLSQLQQLVNERYSAGVAGLAPDKPNFVPTDTRIVVNAPAFRMDVFQNGKLMKTYRVGIGYPEFPLPTGMRRADTIIFNPSWTPPDEPWVKGKFSPGKKVSGASDLNPLGVIKIPIGMPSLIHGGKPAEKIGNFASHGCVGLTNAQVKDFAPLLAKLGGAIITPENIRVIEKNKGKTRSVKLMSRVPIDLRYETIVAIGGSLHVYRDVYERGTNTLENVKAILSLYDVDYDQLSEQEKSDLDEALDEMNRDPRGQVIATDSIPATRNGVAASKIARAKKGKTTLKIKGQKEAEVVITALQGKGYPEPVNLDTGIMTKKK